MTPAVCCPADFNPRSPDGERLSTRLPWFPPPYDFNPRSPDGERRAAADCFLLFGIISIHAPRMGSDRCRRNVWSPSNDFNPRSPDGERPARTSPESNDTRFQSTLPGWGATCFAGFFRHVLAISIHAPRMGSDDVLQLGERQLRISIHAPRMGSDLVRLTVPYVRRDFNPRSPDGERQSCSTSAISTAYFNPRSPDGERPWTPEFIEPLVYFNPRSPDGERLIVLVQWWEMAFISIHAPRMGSDHLIVDFCHCVGISIHAPRMGSDLWRHHSLRRTRDFNPRSPDGERHDRYHTYLKNEFISIHAPRMGSDGTCHKYPSRYDISIHAPRMGSDAHGYKDDAEDLLFQSTLPGWGATDIDVLLLDHLEISIHAPRMGSDYASAVWFRELLISIHAPRMGSDRENGHLRPRYGQNHPFSTLIVSQIVVDVLGTVRKSQKTPAH